MYDLFSVSILLVTASIAIRSTLESPDNHPRRSPASLSERRESNNHCPFLAPLPTNPVLPLFIQPSPPPSQNQQHPHPPTAQHLKTFSPPYSWIFQPNKTKASTAYLSSSASSLITQSLAFPSFHSSTYRMHHYMQAQGIIQVPPREYSSKLKIYRISGVEKAVDISLGKKHTLGGA